MERTSESQRHWLATPVGPRGFTLVELMIVVVILGILAVVASAGYRRYMRSARRGEAIASLNDIRMKQETFYNTYSRYVEASDSEDDFAGAPEYAGGGGPSEPLFGYYSWNQSCPNPANGWCNLNFTPPTVRIDGADYTHFQYFTTGWTPNAPFVPVEIQNPTQRWVTQRARGLPTDDASWCTVVILSSENAEALIYESRESAPVAQDCF